MSTPRLLGFLVGSLGFILPLPARALPICDPTITVCGPPSDIFEDTDSAGNVGFSYTIPETAGAVAEGSTLTVGVLIGSSSISGTVYFGGSSIIDGSHASKRRSKRDYRSEPEQYPKRSHVHF